MMTPGDWRQGPGRDVEVGAHLPPASDRVPAFMGCFHLRFAFEPTVGRMMQGGGGQGEAHTSDGNRASSIQLDPPLLDGNGRVSRLMSHAMAHRAGVGAHGLWSVSREQQAAPGGVDSR